jgi:hypothetical protein
MDVRVSWSPSPSTDVVVQRVSWFINDAEVGGINLVPSVTTTLLSESISASPSGAPLREGDVVKASIVVNDGVSDSEAVEGSIQVPIVPPAPVSNIVLEITG